ncbi:MAG: hypothetical protein HY744_14745 [Deltaproteobacteria bacterium]|nr:hypothetical protein [Deltaproteobacteria bacterium]
METRCWSTFLGLGALLALGCSGSDEETAPPGPAGSTAGFTERGVYHYVLAWDSAGNVPVFGGAHEVVALGERGKFEKIDEPNQPSRLHPDLRNFTKYDPQAKTGETDWKVFASTWWAQKSNGIAKRWVSGAKQDYNDHSDKDRLSPIEKYDLVFNPGKKTKVGKVSHWDAAQMRKPENERGAKHDHAELTAIGPATAWELQNHGVYQDWSHPDSWWGHCNGWSSYATTEPGSFPQRDIKAKLVDGKVTECIGSLENDPQCVLWRMGDVEALLTELYFSDQATFSGRRCNTDPEKMDRDEYGRPKDAACRDLNPGSFHIGVVGLLNKGATHFATNQPGKPAFVIDHNYDWEVWNFPLVKYEVLAAAEVSAEEANKAIGASGSQYKFNPDARKFVKVQLRYWMVSDGVDDSAMAKRADQRGVAPHETGLEYILELSAADEIIGGEWLKVPEYSWSSEKKDLHPDFFWMAVKVQGWGEDADDLGGDDDNPLVAYSKVKALLACANDAKTCAPKEVQPPPQGACVDKCGGQSKENDKTCYCDEACTKYNDCCSDYQSTCSGQAPSSGPSCVGKCGGKATKDGKECWCDDQCKQYGDCCADYASACGGG